MESYEKETKEKIEKGETLPSKLDISTIKYLWQASPLSSSKKNYIPKFLRKIKALQNFSDNELRILSRYMHLRIFNDQDVIFKEFDLGIGLYFIYSGHVDIYVEDNNYSNKTEEILKKHRLVVTLDRRDYFGELALLQDKCIRSATTVARKSCELLGIFSPDLDALIKNHPIVATKLLQSLSMILATRLSAITTEVTRLKYKIQQLEENR